MNPIEKAMREAETIEMALYTLTGACVEIGVSEARGYYKLDETFTKTEELVDIMVDMMLNDGKRVK